MAAGIPGTGGLLDPDDAKEWLAAWKGRIDEMATNARAMGERMQELRVTAVDPDGLVEVTVDSAGALVDLQLGRGIQQVAPDFVARTIMETIREAKLKLADRAQEIVAETMGTDSAAARQVATRIRQQLRDRDGDDTGIEQGGGEQR